jgi:hypothetical protein
MQPIMHSRCHRTGGKGQPHEEVYRGGDPDVLWAKESTSLPSPWAEPTPKPDAERVVFDGRLTNDFFLDAGAGCKDHLVGFTLRCPLPKGGTILAGTSDQIVWLRMDRDYAGLTLEHLRVRHRKRLPVRVVGLEVVDEKELLANRIVDA